MNITLVTLLCCTITRLPHAMPSCTATLQVRLPGEDSGAWQEVLLRIDPALLSGRLCPSQAERLKPIADKYGFETLKSAIWRAMD